MMSAISFIEPSVGSLLSTTLRRVSASAYIPIDDRERKRERERESARDYEGGSDDNRA